MTVSLPPDAQRSASTLLGPRIFALCALVAFLDGFDTQSIGPAAPAIAHMLGLSSTALGPIFGLSQLGFLIGAILFGAAGDRSGRKRMLILMTALFALATLGTALAFSYPQLLACRLLAGVGLGGASPNFVSLASEFAPPARRARHVTLLWAAVPLGGMAGSFASAAMMQPLGWRAIFLLGAAAPLPLLVLIARLMPESRETGGVRRAPVMMLFTEGRAERTVWLWLASFMTWTTLVVTAFWTPALLQHAGWSPSAAASMLALNNGGGVIGTLVIGTLIGRLSAQGALRLVLAGAAAFILAMGSLGGHAGLFAFAALLAGFCASGAGGAMLALSANIYPSAARSTAVGWALGFGRIGTILGPMLAGILVTAQWPMAAVYAAIAATALLGALFTHMLARAIARAEAKS